MKKEGVIFDMDGLMFDTQSIYNKAFVDIGLHDYGIHITEDFLVAVMGRSGDDMYNTVNRYFPDIDAFKYVQKVYSLVAERVKTDLVARPGLYELLPYLKKEGYKLAVSSGSDRSIVMSNLETSGLTDYFSVVVCGDEHELGKPDPEGYLITASRLGCDPKDCIPGFTVVSNKKGMTQHGSADNRILRHFPEQMKIQYFGNSTG